MCELLIDDVCYWVLNAIESLGASVRVRDYCVGVRYTYVLIDVDGTEWLGTAITLTEDVIGSPYSIPNEVRVEELINYVSSSTSLIKSLGTALLNALSNYLLWGAKYRIDFRLVTGSEITKLIHGIINEPVLVIGNMGPLIRELRSLGIKDIRVVERNPCFRCGNALPDTSIPRLVPSNGTLVVTGATLVNDTIDYIMELSRVRGCRLVLVGPTASVHPKPLLNKGVYAVASMHPVSNEGVIKVIKLGGGRWLFSKYCRHYVAIR